MSRALWLAVPALFLSTSSQVFSGETDKKVVAIVDKAKSEFDKGDYEQAIETINQAIALDPGHGYSFILRGVAHLKLGKDSEIALRDLNEGLTKSPDESWGYRARGWLFNKLGKTGKALAELNKAIEIDATDSYALYQRGRISLDQLGTIELAIIDFTKAIELKPQFPDAFRSRAAALFRKDECDNALADINKAIELDPGCGNYYGLRAQIYQRAVPADLPKALQDIERAIFIEPRCRAYRAVRADIYCTKGEVDRGFAELKKDIELDPQDDLSRLQLAQILLQKNQALEALPLIRQVLRHPQTPPASLEDAQFLEGDCFYQLHLYPMAAQVYQNQLNKFPSGRYHKQANQKLFDIANYWLDPTRSEIQAAETLTQAFESGRADELAVTVTCVWRVIESLLTETLFAQESRALQILEDVVRNDDKFPDADKAIFYAATVNRLRGANGEAFRCYCNVVEKYPQSSHAAKAAMQALQLIDEGASVEKARHSRLVVFLVNQRPNEAAAEQPLLDRHRKLVQETDKARADLSKAIEIDPTDASALYERGTTFLNQPGKMDLAIADFTKAIELKPRFPEAFAQRAAALLKKNEYKVALADINKAIELDPGRGAYYKLRGEIHEKWVPDDLPTVLQDFGKATSVFFFGLRGDLQFGRGNLDEAISDLTRAIAVDSTGLGDLFAIRAKAFNSKHDFEKARGDIDIAIHLEPENAQYFIVRASICMNQQRFEQVLPDADKAITLNPSLADGYFFRGVAYSIRAEDDKAIQDFSKAILLWKSTNVRQSLRFTNDQNTETASLVGEAYCSRGIAHSNRKDPEKALADLNEALRLDPDNARAYWGRGTVAFDQKDYDKAIADFGNMIRLSPSDLAGYKGRADAYAALGEWHKAAADDKRARADFDGAVEDYSKVIVLLPKSTVDPKYLGENYRERGIAHWQRTDPEKALADLNEALRLNPGDAYAFWGKGAVAFDRKEYDKAIADFSAMIRLLPSDPSGYEGRAKAYTAVGDQHKAAADEQRAKELRSGEQKRP